jgi:hypothetical protein
MESFYIVATNPYSYSWSYTNKVTSTALCPFIFKDGRIVSENGQYGLIISEGEVSFSSATVFPAVVELEKTDIKTNFRIKCGGRYIRHRDSVLYCEPDDGSALFKNDSTWIFMPTKINPNHTFVIARYAENCSWARLLPGRVIIYNKGKDNIAFQRRDNVTIERLENVGREGHTYLHYMFTHYDSLPERVTFLQADPFPHSQNILELCCMVGDFTGFQPLSTWYIYNNTPTLRATDHHIKRLNGAAHVVYPVDTNGQFFEFYDYCWPNWRKQNKMDQKSPLSTFLENTDLAHKIKFAYRMCISALFSVSRANIHLNTRQHYQNIMAELIRYNPQGGFQGYLLERLWNNILTPNSEGIRDTNLLEDLYGTKKLLCFTNDTKKVSSIFKKFNVVAFPRLIIPEREFINHIKVYSSILHYGFKNEGAELNIVANLDCNYVDPAGAETSLIRYLSFLIKHIGEWDLFLGAPRDVQPVKIISRDPFIIECTSARSLTFAVHSYKSASIIMEYASDQTKYDNDLDTALHSRLGAQNGKIWIPYPVLCYSGGDTSYISTMNKHLEEFIARQG